MENEYVQYEWGVALKKLGFDEACSAFYKLGDSELYYDTILQSQKVKFRNNTELNAYGDLKEKISAPLYQQAFRWFRDNHGYHAYVETVLKKGFEDKDVFYGACYKLMILNVTYGIKLCKTYEEAEIECLRRLIKIVKAKKKWKDLKHIGTNKTQKKKNFTTSS